MGTERIYENDRRQDYATGKHGQVVSRNLFAVVERGDMPLDGGFGEAAIIEVETEADAITDSAGEASLRVRIDTVPQDTIATSPDAAVNSAIAMQSLSNINRGQLGFKVEYYGD